MKFFAPRLRKFTWSFNLGGELNGMGCYEEQFGEAEEGWLRSVISAAISRNIPLDSVHVNFYPYDDICFAKDLSGVTAWDRIDVLTEEFKSCGIRITCASRKAQYQYWWRTAQPGYQSKEPTPEPEHIPGAHLPDPDSDAESIVELDGDFQQNKITDYFRPLPQRRMLVLRRRSI